MKILAVDDELSILELIPLLAARVGYPNVEVAAGAREALQLLSEADPAFDCLVLDINMPEMDGIELCRTVRQMDRYRRIPIIMLTAMSERQYVDAAFQAGATDYATKPFDLTELGSRLRLANELLLARRDAERLRTASERLSVEQNGHNQAIDIAGVPNLVELATLKSYLGQLSRAGVTNSQIMAVAVDHWQDVHAKGTADEFEYALREVASAIGSVMVTSIVFLSYVGNGTFLVVSSSAEELDIQQMEGDIQFWLDERNLQYDNGIPMNFEIVMGAPLRPISEKLDEIDRSIERAMARLAARNRTHTDRRDRVNIR
jgi:DNA-binding response OmpR family regulator